jgi:hypothetical protein
MIHIHAGLQTGQPPLKDVYREIIRASEKATKTSYWVSTSGRFLMISINGLIVSISMETVNLIC